MREALPAGAVLVNREGHQFTRHTVSFHAPDPADAGLLARQAEIEAAGEGASRRSTARLAAAQSRAAGRRRRAWRSAAPSWSRRAMDIAGGRRRTHDAQIEHLKLAQAQERYLERSAQMRAELEELEQEAARGRQAIADGRAAAERLGGRDRRRARGAGGGARGARRRGERPRRAARQRCSAAEREAQDALFGERECASKIAEIDNAVKVIDQQIERADAEVAKLTEELAVDPIPQVRQALDAAVESRIACEKTLAEARNVVEAAAGGAARAGGGAAAGRVARRAAARARRRAAPEGAGGAAQLRAVRRPSCARRAPTRRGCRPRPKARRAPRRCRARSRASRKRSASSAR